MKLITETSDFSDITSYTTISESENKKSMFIEGVFLVGNTKNKNGRIYPTEMLENAVNTYIQTYVKENRAIGELGHPSGPAINADRASHLITELRREGNNFIGKAKVLESLPMGSIVKGLLEAGVKIGVSSRGLGSLKEENGTMVVQSDFKIATVDVVTDPSAPGAFVKGIMENIDWFYDERNGWQAVELAERAKKKMKTMSTRQIEEQQLAIFESYFSKLVNR